MSITIKHKKHSDVPDGSDTSLVRPSDWNDDHDSKVNSIDWDLISNVPKSGRGKEATITCLTIPGIVSVSGQTLLRLHNTIFYEPILVMTPITIDQVVIEVSIGQTGGLIQLGIYKADIDWQPTELIVDIGPIDASSAGIKIVSIDLKLEAGRYLNAYNNNVSGINCRCIRGGANLIGFSPTLGINMFISSIYVSSVFGNMPSPPLKWNTTTKSDAPIRYFVFYRVSIP